MGKVKIGLDVDDVIANFYKAACKYCNVKFINRNHWGKESEEFIIPAWEAMQQDDEFWYNLEKLNHVDFDFDYYITSLPPHLYNNRLEWLQRHGFPKRPVHVGHDKVKIAKALGVKIIIDDKPSTVEAFIKAGLHAIHYIPPYSTLEPVSPYYTYNFEEIKDIINKIKKKHYEKGEGSRIQYAQTRTES